MSKFTRPKVVLSKCLCGAQCRWDCDRLDYPFVRTLRKYATIIPVCPEMEIGLGVPRDRMVLVERANGVALHQPSTGKQFAQKMNSFARRFVADHTDVDGFILKHKSPSCGVRGVKLYDSAAPDARFTRTGIGLFAASVLKHCSQPAITDEDQLEQHRRRDHWLTKLFTLAAFRTVRKSNSIKRLNAFHTQHWQLLEAHQQRITYKLDRTLAKLNPNADSCATIEQYGNALARILATPPRRAKALRPFTEALHAYAHYLSAQDISRFELQLESYRPGELRLSEIRKAVQIWAVRYDKIFTRQDAVYRPYPGPLADA